MKMQTDKSSCLLLGIADIVAILLGMAAVARILGWPPDSIGGLGNIHAIEVLSAAFGKPVAEAGDMDLPQAPSNARSKGRCPECSVIVSMQEIDASGMNASLGAVVQEVAGNENGMRGTSAKSHKFTVRLEGGSHRVIIDANPASWRPGQRVIVIDGTNPAHQ